LESIQKLQHEITDVEIRHSTPEAYLAGLNPTKAYPTHKGDLQRSFAGCYTSISPIKRGMRRGEALLRSAESWSAMAWWFRGKEYPKAKLEQAWKDILFNTFHDILPGSTLEAAVQDVMEKYGRSAHICRELRLAAQLMLLPNIMPKLNTIPIYVFNPHAYVMKAPVDFEFLITHSPMGNRKSYALYDDEGRRVTSQDTNGPYEQSQVPINWQRNLTFMADVPAMSLRRYEIRSDEKPRIRKSKLTVKQTKKHITVENKWMIAKFLHASGGLASLIDKATGRELLRGSIGPVAMKDNLDAWGTESEANFNEPLGNFTPLSQEDVGDWVGTEKAQRPALNVLFQGPVSVTIQSLVGWKRSRAMQHFTVYADSQYIDVFLRVHWQERRQMLKWVLPFRLQDAEAVCEVPFAAIKRSTDGVEHVGGRWVRLEENNRNKFAIGVANDGQYGFAVKQNGNLGLSLLRGAINCRFGDIYAWQEKKPVSTDEYHTYMDQGQHDFRFRVLWGKAPALAKALIPAAMELNLPLEPMFIYNQPTAIQDNPNLTESLITVTPSTVTLVALKKAEDSDGLILRLNETLGRKTKTSIRMTGMKNPFEIELHPFEIKTIYVRRSAKGVQMREIGLLEE
jgi:alpha-mannosidase